MPLNLTPADQARYWSKVDVRGPDDCWPWTAGCFTSGYGQFWLRGTNVRAHRVAKELAGQPLTNRGCHTCDSPPCCNPAHVFDGTDAENIADRDSKGRHWVHSGATHWATLDPEKARLRTSGAANPMSKLTAADVTEIRQRRANGEKLRTIAASFSVSLSRISAIALHHSWTELP